MPRGEVYVVALEAGQDRAVGLGDGGMVDGEEGEIEMVEEGTVVVSRWEVDEDVVDDAEGPELSEMDEEELEVVMDVVDVVADAVSLMW